MKNYIVVIFFLFILIITGSFANKWDDEVTYPEGFRLWTHVKTTLIEKQSHNKGFVHIYANNKALQGYSTGKFPEGSVLVFDVLEANLADSLGKEGARKHIDVMIKDSIKFASTGGWGFEEFKGNSKTERILTIRAKTQCFNCHAKQPDYVFSELRN
jgi:hypothetical protein